MCSEWHGRVKNTESITLRYTETTAVNIEQKIVVETMKRREFICYRLIIWSVPICTVNIEKYSIRITRTIYRFLELAVSKHGQYIFNRSFQWLSLYSFLFHCTTIFPRIHLNKIKSIQSFTSVILFHALRSTHLYSFYHHSLSPMLGFSYPAAFPSLLLSFSRTLLYLGPWPSPLYPSFALFCRGSSGNLAR